MTNKTPSPQPQPPRPDDEYALEIPQSSFKDELRGRLRQMDDDVFEELYVFITAWAEAKALRALVGLQTYRLAENHPDILVQRDDAEAAIKQAFKENV
jgi:hypothetical protein